MADLTPAEIQAAADAKTKAAADAAKASPSVNVASVANITAAQKAVYDAKKSLEKAEAELAKLGGGMMTAETTAEQDAKRVLNGPKTPVQISGVAGGPFNIEGKGYGTTAGTVIISGRVLPTTSWQDHVIKGMLPMDLPPGPVSVKTATGEWTGVWPMPKLTPEQVAAAKAAQDAKIAADIKAATGKS
jgi:hypothetical protein